MTDIEPVHGIDRAAVMQYLGLKNDVPTQALLAICSRYGLDPLMKHIVLISGKPYVTRDGYLHVAHQTGQLDGIEVLEEGETDKEWWAKVAVHRKDMSKPFTYRGRYPHDGGQKKYGPEMAVKTAEVMALRRAFDVSGIPAADEQWDDAIDVTPTAPRVVPDDLADLIADIDAIPEVGKRQDLLDAISTAIWNETGVPIEDTPEKWFRGVRKMVDKALTPAGLEPNRDIREVDMSDASVSVTFPGAAGAPEPEASDEAINYFAERGMLSPEEEEKVKTGGSPAGARAVMNAAKAARK